MNWQGVAARTVVAAGVACTVAAALAGPAAAARPAKGTFVGFHGPARAPTDNLYDIAGKLRVARRGRSLARRSYIDTEFDCGRDRSGTVGGRIRLDRGGLGLPVSRKGTFGLTMRAGHEVLRVRGRFTAPDTATVRWRLRTPPGSPRNKRRPGLCVSGPKRVTLWRRGRPPFEGCREQRRVKEVASGPTGRIYEQLNLAFVNGFTPFVYACLFDEDRRVTLGRNYDDEEIDMTRIAGVYAAFHPHDSCCGGSLKVLDLSDGSQVKDLTLGTLQPPPGVANPGRFARDVVLKPNASVAWISSHLGGEAPEVWASDSQGTRLLDSGEIGEESLELGADGSTLTWLKAGVQQTATLD